MPRVELSGTYHKPYLAFCPISSLQESNNHTSCTIIRQLSVAHRLASYRELHHLAVIKCAGCTSQRSNLGTTYIAFKRTIVKSMTESLVASTTLRLCRGDLSRYLSLPLSSLFAYTNLVSTPHHLAERTTRVYPAHSQCRHDGNILCFFVRDSRECIVNGLSPPHAADRWSERLGAALPAFIGARKRENIACMKAGTRSKGQQSQFCAYQDVLCTKKR